MFGFGRIASYDYFAHLEAALVSELRAAGEEVVTYVLDVPPTASLRTRAVQLADFVAETCQEDRGDNGPIHLVGHSTGGLDARLVASPDIVLPVGSAHNLAWARRLASVTTLSTPHYGTPLAAAFATVSGQRMLYAASAITHILLAWGEPPVNVASAVVFAMKRFGRSGFEVRAVEEATDALLHTLDGVRAREVRAYLQAIKKDQGAILQLAPEAMELFQIGVQNRPNVLYQCTASIAPPPSALTLASMLGGPWRAASSAVFATLYGFTSRCDSRYPCGPAELSRRDESTLRKAFGEIPPPSANDGVVPIRSQIWGKIAWSGFADHLDVLGHFSDDDGDKHIDWFRSGAKFTRARFAALTAAITQGLLESTARWGANHH